MVLSDVRGDQTNGLFVRLHVIEVKTDEQTLSIGFCPVQTISIQCNSGPQVDPWGLPKQKVEKYFSSCWRIHALWSWLQMRGAQVRTITKQQRLNGMTSWVSRSVSVGKWCSDGHDEATTIWYAKADTTTTMSCVCCARAVTWWPLNF